MADDERPARTAILDAIERLLSDRRSAELSVADVIAEAGVSRTSFYAHYGSRGAALAACLRRVVGEIADAVDPIIASADVEPAVAVRASLERWAALASAHGPLLATASEEWPIDPELRELWLAQMAGFAAAIADAIRRARARDRAPDGPDPEALAAILVWGCEQVLHVSLAGEAAGLAGPEAIVEPLTRMMVAGAFGG